MRRVAVVLTVMGLVAALVPPTQATPAASTNEEYLAYGRVFPDPHGCHVGEPGFSPWSKGRVCATDFLQFRELESGLSLLEELFPKFVEVYRLDEDFNCKGKPVNDPAKACADFRSAGLPVTTNTSGEGFTRDRRPLYMVAITDESVDNDGKKFFVFPLSIHGIERAGVEGGTRAAEDLATWAACEQDPTIDVCANEGPFPHPLMEATPDDSVTAGQAMRRSVVVFIYPNPDGWLRGERTTGTQFYQRYNGNGVDLNRDWPAQGFTFRPYTPWSEPESRGLGTVLREFGPKDDAGNAKWTGGIDLHGQLVDRAFSFTLIGGSERPYDKNQRVLQTVKGAWKDAEARLAWSPLIKPNDAPEDDERFYGVQWGTIWDTIAYTVTGALGDWIDSPIGLNADGIDNEMSLSHLSNCGVGSCFEPDVEQLHVDGNKSLIYSMINYSLLPENNTFKTKGKVGYLFNRGKVSKKSSPLKSPPKFIKLPPQDPIEGVQLDPINSYTYEFDVLGPKDDVYNGGLGVTITCTNAQGVGPCAASEARLERRNDSREDNTQGEDWETVNSYFNQSNLYVQAGQALHANLPTPGRYRVRITGSGAQGVFRADIEFTKQKAWPDPGQVGYRVTNMKFWKDLKRFTKPRIEKVTAKQLATTRKWKRRYDTIVITNKVYPKLAFKLRKWVARFNANLVLTDEALNMLGKMKVVEGEANIQPAYAGYVNFGTLRRPDTYKDQLAKKIDQPGAAEGSSGGLTHRRQTYEPVPLGYSIQTPNGGDANNSPVWFITQDKWRKAKGKQRAVGTTFQTTNVSYGEIKYFGGRIRIIGALLPMPTNQFDHPFGLGNYALTYSGYQLLKNSLKWNKPPRKAQFKSF